MVRHIKTSFAGQIPMSNAVSVLDIKSHVGQKMSVPQIYVDKYYSDQMFSYRTGNGSLGPHRIDLLTALTILVEVSISS